MPAQLQTSNLELQTSNLLRTHMIFIVADIIEWLKANQLPCPVKKYLHTNCPGCGLQRSFIALAQGDLGLSIQYHPATIPLLLFFIYAFFHLIFRFRYGNRIIIYSYLFIAVLTLCNYFYKIECVWADRIALTFNVESIFIHHLSFNV